MLRELLTDIVQLARTSAEPKLVDSKDPRALAWLTHNGNITAHAVPVPPRNHKVESLEDLIRLATRFNPVDGVGNVGPVPSPVVWYNADRVVLVLDDAGHRLETATLELAKSDMFLAVERLKSGGWFVQKEFVRLLKVILAGALPDVDLLTVVRRVKFENGTITTGEVKKSRESMGKEITAAVSAEGEIPDFVRLTVPVYKVFDLKAQYPVNCIVEVDVQDGRFRLMPCPDEIQKVLHLAMAKIADELQVGLPDSVPCYLGAP